MPSAEDLLTAGNVAVVAPAGHGKTELIAKLAALGQRTLILTHTHAGIHAIRGRLRRLGVPAARASIDTIAGWSLRYAHAFPHAGRPPAGAPQGAEWDLVYRGATSTLDIDAVRQVVRASYERILIDEYQDCTPLQHLLATHLSSILPTQIFGDPMQGIFEFAGATLSWDDDIHPAFRLAGTLPTPHRWASRNPALGDWIAETRDKLMRGEAIDLADPRINFRECEDAFDMGVLFDSIEGKEGSFAAIHCNKGICYRLAKASGGGFQAIEEIAANRLQQFAIAWDAATDGTGRLQAIASLLRESFHVRPATEGEEVDPEETAISAALKDIAPGLGSEAGAEAAAQFIALSRKHPRWRLFRSELWRDAERVAIEVANGRAPTMTAATDTVRRRVSRSGRRLPRRTISTPLLLKGLEFDHVVIPDAAHFSRERQAQAKLFYVAIARATQSLTIASSERWLRLPIPRY